jgi:[ribosomal protein S18]-alanine N-acetyltransferase
MTLALRIDPMAGRHINAVCDIDRSAYPNPWSAATWRKELAASDRVHLVAIDDEALVGHAGLLFVLDEAHVTTVAVDPGRQGEGIASRLLVALLGEARGHGSSAATLEVRAAHLRPQRLYGRFGFRPVGLRRAYYSAPVDDAVVMWLHDLCGVEAVARTDEVADHLGRADAKGPS